MSEWKAKRFWRVTEIRAEAGGYGVYLDGRPVKTPAKAPLLLPTEGFAEAVHAEWDAVGELIDPTRMPFTRTANAAIDKVAHQKDEVADMIADYGGTDQLCYRAEAPEALRARQDAAWDPLLDWAEATYGARLAVTSGVMHLAQDAAALAPLRRAVHACNPFQLAALHDLVSLSGSLVIGLAAAGGRQDPETLWALSRIDETWQEEQWGEDEEAQAHAALKRAAFLHAAEVWRLSGDH
ncbi:ATP12 family chaperone protein [Marinovum sp.]|uniref:ATP12 family chaperone protein n=1 Tax=Marinovum sp. TaxID=2024839 RepID=UPI002B278D23|nr:ATP12 family protein [Marinovum sp.]